MFSPALGRLADLLYEPRLLSVELKPALGSTFFLFLRGGGRVLDIRLHSYRLLARSLLSPILFSWTAVAARVAL